MNSFLDILLGDHLHIITRDQCNTACGSLVLRMALLDYPVPDLDVTLAEASRVLRLVLSPEEYVHYKSALSQQTEALMEIHKNLKSSVSAQGNWVTDQFKQRLLSCFDSLPTSTAIPSVLPPSKGQAECAQLQRATTLLWAVAKLYSEPWLVEGDVPTERTQQSEVFAASRLPGKHQDRIKVWMCRLMRHSVLPNIFLCIKRAEGNAEQHTSELIC